MIRRGAAAAAHQPCAHAHEGGGFFRKGLGRQAEHGFPVHQFGQPRVGLGQHGHGGTGEETLHERGHFLGPETAIEAEGVHTEILHGFRENFRRRPGQARALLEGHGHHDGQIALGADGGHGDAHFCQIELGFHEEEVHPALGEATGLLAESFVKLKRVEIAEGPHKAAAGPHVTGHENGPPRGFGGGTGDAGHLPVEGDGFDPGGKFQARAAKGAGQDDVRSGGEVVGMDAPEHVRAVQTELFRVLPGGQPPSLKHGPHAPVEDENTTGCECATKIRHAVLLGSCLVRQV